MIITTALRLALGGGPRRKGTLKRLRGGILGLALSLIPLTIVVHVTEGMIQGITSRFLETGTGHIRLVSRQPQSEDSLQDLAQRLSGLDGVTATHVEHQGLGLIRSDRGNSGVQIRGVNQSWFDQDPSIQRYLDVVVGTFDVTTEDSLVLGQGLAEELEVGPGDEVRILSVRRGAAGSLLTRVTRFTVQGIVSSGYRDLDRLWAFIPLGRARTILPGDSGNSFVTLKIQDPFVLDNPLINRNTQLGQALVREIRGQLNAEWRLFTWFDLERSQYMNFLGTRDMLVFIMVVILLVAGVNIASTMINLVAERQEELAVLKALGASPWTLGRIIFTIAGVSGALGILAGLSLGSLGVVFINEILLVIEWIMNIFASPGEQIQILNPEFYLESIPVILLPGQILLLGLAAGIMTFISSALPTLKAMSIPPAVLYRRE